MAEKIAYLDRSCYTVVLTTAHGNTYRYDVGTLLGAEMQGDLGYVIASAFVGDDRDAGHMTMDIYKKAVQEALYLG